MRRADSIKQGTEYIGSQVTAKVVKNKVAAPFKKATFDLIFGKGISRAAEVLDLGVQEKLVNKSGSWYTLGDEKLGQGRDNARQFLEENPQLLHTIESEIRIRYHLPAGGKAPVAAQQNGSAAE